MLYQTEKSMSELGDKITPEEKEIINNKKDNLKKALESNNIEEIKSKLDELTKEFNKLAEKIYQQTANTQQQAQEPNESNPQADDVVDADFEVVDDEESQS